MSEHINNGNLLIWVLWVLRKGEPLVIDEAQVEECYRKFSSGGPTLLVLDTPNGVEVSVTSREDASRRREFRDAQIGSTH
jgi:hypothetical protein